MAPRLRQAVLVAFCLGSLSLLYLFHQTFLVRFGTISDQSEHGPLTQPHPIINDTRLPYIQKQLDEHPITLLIAQAQERQRELLSSRSHDVKSAARRYRDRRGKHPPPGFDAWLAYAQETDAVIVESFFDRIYHDLQPFWSVTPAELRRQSHPRHWDLALSVRKNRAILKNEGVDPMSRMRFWMGMMEELEAELPDVDIPINGMDESRVLVPWEEINRMMKKVAALKPMPASVDRVVRSFTGLPDIDAAPEGEDPPLDWHWITEKSNEVWNVVQETCPPYSPGANTIAIHVVNDPPLMPTEWPMHSYKGYVANWSLTADPCQHPHLRSLHGAFIEPVSLSTSQSLIPLFGGSKLPMNNEILIPAAMYLSPDELYAGGQMAGPAWADKKDGLVWRGVASGGRNKFDTWTHFHRHRFLQMLNSTAVALAEAGDLRLGKNLSFKVPDQKAYPLITTFDRPQDYLSGWLEEVGIDARFNHLWCFPTQDPGHMCSYNDAFFATAPGIPMTEQYMYKFLPDIDGNSFSARFRAFLQSTSLPIKASIYTEWHDSRLMPWVHFAPMDNSYVDLYGILDYFLADEMVSASVGPDDTVAGRKTQKSKGETIAMAGKTWAEQVLRREDMKLYTWRLLLEWARVCDDKRDLLGFVDDLV